MIIFGHSVLFEANESRDEHCVEEDSSEALPQTKVAIIAPKLSILVS